MVIRFAAASGLALAAALFVATTARAQSFFSYYELSPRQIVGMLADDGYELRGPMWRRGDVYICDVTSVSGRTVRLIVDAHDGHVLEHFASTPRWRNSDEDNTLRPPRDIAGGNNSGAEQEDRSAPRRSQLAIGDPLSPQSRASGGDSLLSPKPSSPTPDDADAPKPKRSAIKKHRPPSVAKTSPVSPEATPSAETTKPTGVPTSSVAAFAPSGAAELKKPAEEAVKSIPAEAAKPAAETTATPSSSPNSPQTKAEIENHTAGEGERAPAIEKSKADPAHKKINDLPVGTLD